MTLNPWLNFSLILLGIWSVIWLAKPRLRKEMFWVSLFTMPFGLTEPLFVPEYWNPPSLFNLASRTGFDIESLIFSFAVGGIVSILYEIFVKVKHEKFTAKEIRNKKNKFHLLALISSPLIFVLLLFTNLNPIYSVSIALFVGSIAAILCRPDLKKNNLAGGFLFLSLYFVFFLSFNLVYPNFVQQTWNLTALSGILILGVPLEELMFAFTFGMLWSSIYEHVMWYRLKRV